MTGVTEKSVTQTTRYLLPPPSGYPKNIEELLNEEDLALVAESILDGIAELLQLREAA